MRPCKIKIIVEKHKDGYVAYPIGMKDVVVGQGDTYSAALADIQTAIRIHVAAIGNHAWDRENEVMEAFVTEAEVS